MPECDAIVEEAKAHLAAGGAGSGFTLSTTNYNAAVADLPQTLGWLGETGLPRVAALAGECYGESAIGPPEKLLIYRALVVGYDAAAGLTHQEVHRDGSLVTCVINLSERDEYSGGGTFLEPLGDALAPPKGHAVLQASALRHAGHMIDAGERWVLILFMISEEMAYGEHVRHFKARAQRANDEGDFGDEIKCLELARAICDDSDHELLYDQAVGLHERGEVEAALELYERAVQLNSNDVKLLKNRAAARQELGLDADIPPMPMAEPAMGAEMQAMPVGMGAMEMEEATRDGAMDVRGMEAMPTAMEAMGGVGAVDPTGGEERDLLIESLLDRAERAEFHCLQLEDEATSLKVKCDSLEDEVARLQFELEAAISGGS